MERCDGYQGGVWRYGKVRQLRGMVKRHKVYHLAGSVIREMLKVLKMIVS